MDTSNHPDRTVEQLALELLARWQSMRIDLVPGASEGQIRHFRMRNGVALPNDLAQFFRIVNGMRGARWTPKLSSDSGHWAS